MNYQTKSIAGALFFTISIVGFSFAGGVVPSAAYAEEYDTIDVSYPWGDASGSDIVDISYPSDGSGNFFGNWGNDCCGSDILDVSYPWGDASGNDIIDVSYPWGSENDIVDVSYPFGSDIVDVSYPWGSNDIVDVSYPYSGYYEGIEIGGCGSSCGGGSYGSSYSNSFASGSSYASAHSYASAISKSTVQYIDKTKKYYNVQNINPFIPRPSCEIRQALPYGSNYGAHLSWTSYSASSAYITNIGSVAVSGSQYIYPTVTTTYTMTVYGQGGSNICSTTVQGYTPITPIPVTQYIPPYVPPTNTLYCTISANPTTSQNGIGSILNWTSYGAISAMLSDGVGNVVLNGSLTVRPESSRVYTLTVRDNTGRTNTCFTTVSIYGAPYVSLTSIPYTGFDGGPMAQFIYWFSLVLFSGAAGYLVVNYRGGIQNVVADLFSARSYAPAYVTPDAVILNETIFAKEHKKEVASEIRVNEHIVAEAVMQKNTEAEMKDSMILENRKGETPRLVINRR